MGTGFGGQQTYEEFLQSLENPALYPDPSLYPGSGSTSSDASGSSSSAGSSSSNVTDSTPSNGNTSSSTSSDTSGKTTTTNTPKSTTEPVLLPDNLTLSSGVGFLEAGNGSHHITFYNESKSSKNETYIYTGTGDNQIIFGSTKVDTSTSGTGDVSTVYINAGQGENNLDLTALGNTVVTSTKQVDEATLINYLSNAIKSTGNGYELNLGSQKIVLSNVDNIVVSLDHSYWVSQGIGIAFDDGSNKVHTALSIALAVTGVNPNMLQNKSIFGKLDGIVFGTCLNLLQKPDITEAQIIEFLADEYLPSLVEFSKYGHDNFGAIKYLWNTALKTEFDPSLPENQSFLHLSNAQLLQKAVDYIEQTDLTPITHNGILYGFNDNFYYSVKPYDGIF